MRNKLYTVLFILFFHIGLYSSIFQSHNVTASSYVNYSYDFSIANGTIRQHTPTPLMFKSSIPLIEEVFFAPVRPGAQSIIGLRTGDIIYTLAMGFGPMLSSSAVYVPFSYRGCLYFARMINESVVRELAIGDWIVNHVRYIATAGYDEICVYVNPSLRDYTLEKSITVASRDNIALVVLSYRNIGQRTIVLEQYPTHLHRGTDGIGVVTVFPRSAENVVANGLYIDNPGYVIPDQVVNDIRSLHSRTELVINDRIIGRLSELGRWITYHWQSPGRVLVKHRVNITSEERLDIYLYALNDIIQIISNNLIITNKYINNGVLDLQHSSVVLEPGSAKSYYYVVSFGKEISETDLTELMKTMTSIVNSVESYLNTTRSPPGPETSIPWIESGFNKSPRSRRG